MEQAVPPAPAKAPHARDLVADALRALIEQVGEPRATQIVGLSRPTVSRLVARLGVNPASLAIAAQRLGINLSGSLADSPRRASRDDSPQGATYAAVAPSTGPGDASG